MAVVGIAWCVGLVVLFHVSWIFRNRAAWARRTVDFLKQFTKEKQDYAILVWAITGDFVLFMILLGLVIGARS